MVIDYFMAFRIGVWTRSREFIKVPLTSVTYKRAMVPYNCLSLDLSENEDIQTKGLSQIYLRFKPLSGVSVEVKVLDKMLECNRKLKNNIFYYSGDRMKFENLGTYFCIVD